MVGYLTSLVRYFKTAKGRHDLLDYLRAAVIMAAVMAVVRVAVDLVRSML